MSTSFQIRSSTTQKLWSSTQYVKSLMEKLDSKGTGEIALGMSTKEARVSQNDDEF